MRDNAAAIAAERRPGQLATLGSLALTCPCPAAHTLAPRLGLTISGAGCSTAPSGSACWSKHPVGAHGVTYVTRDVALSLDLVSPSRGRPPLLPAPIPALDSIFTAFDPEMAEFVERMKHLGRSKLASVVLND